MQLFFLVLITFVVGALIGTVGVGGILLIPALGSFAGLPTHTAMGTALFSFFFTGLLGTWLYHRRGSIDWGVTLPVCAGALVFGYFGSLANAGASVTLLNVLLSLIIIFAGIYALLAGKISGVAPLAASRFRLFTLLAIGSAVGFGSGLTGVGGPVLAVPFMVAVGFHPLTSIATGQVVQITAALSGSIGNFQNGFIDFSIAWWVTLIELLGVSLGVVLAHRASGAVLKKIVSTVCILVGGYLLVRSF